jgi:hypothetical protein
MEAGRLPLHPRWILMTATEAGRPPLHPQRILTTATEAGRPNPPPLKDLGMVAKAMRGGKEAGAKPDLPRTLLRITLMASPATKVTRATRAMRAMLPHPHPLVKPLVAALATRLTKAHLGVALATKGTRETKVRRRQRPGLLAALHLRLPSGMDPLPLQGLRLSVLSLVRLLFKAISSAMQHVQRRSSVPSQNSR